MFDFEHIQGIIGEEYFKIFWTYSKPDESKYFIVRWLDLIHSYTKTKGFISFDPSVPVLHLLEPQAKLVVLASFPNTKLKGIPSRTSVFPLYPFRVEKDTVDETCRIGLEFFYMYLDLTGIWTVYLYNL